MNTCFYNIDKSIITYWHNNNLTEQDFYCRNCHKLMLNVDELQNVVYVNDNKKNNRPLFVYQKKNKPSSKLYIESETNRWLVKGRILSNKTYFRHLCWDCFFEKLATITDITKKARKNKWYAKVSKGLKPIPAASTSPSFYFKELFDISDDALQIERAKFDTASLDSFIRRYGKEGQKKFEIYSKRQSYTCSKEYFMNEKGMTETEWYLFNQNRASTKENFIKRYGEIDGLTRWNAYCKHEAYAGNKIEYFIEKYGEIDGKQKYLDVCSKKVLSLQNFVNKYGSDIGVEKFNALRNKPYSNISQELFNELDKQLGNFASNSRFFIKNGEATIAVPLPDGTRKICCPDYLLNNKIIEFFGDYWHANPLTTDSTDITDYIHQRDDIRIKLFESLGYKVKIVWESDYNADKEKVINECTEFLKQ